MSQAEFTSMLIVTIGSILGVISVGSALISTYITKPNKEANKELKKSLDALNSTIIKLDATMDATNNDVKRIDNRVNKHGERLDLHDIILARNNLK